MSNKLAPVGSAAGFVTETEGLEGACACDRKEHTPWVGVYVHARACLQRVGQM